MLQSERKQRIIELLQNGEFIKNKELERYLQVSAATIRRDLTSLENDGLIKRIHGGAKIKSAMSSRLSVSERRDLRI